MSRGQSFNDFLDEELENDPTLRQELEDDFEDMRLAVQLALLREKRGMSQQELSQLSGISQPMICRIERGDQQPTWPTIRKLQRALGGRLVSEPDGGVALYDTNAGDGEESVSPADAKPVPAAHRASRGHIPHSKQQA